MCYSCRNFNDEEATKIFSQYNIDMNEYLSFSDSVLADLNSTVKDNTNSSNKYKQ